MCILQHFRAMSWCFAAYLLLLTCSFRSVQTFGRARRSLTCRVCSLASRLLLLGSTSRCYLHCPCSSRKPRLGRAGLSCWDFTNFQPSDCITIINRISLSRRAAVGVAAAGVAAVGVAAVGVAAVGVAAVGVAVVGVSVYICVAQSNKNGIFLIFFQNFFCCC